MAKSTAKLSTIFFTLNYRTSQTGITGYKYNKVFSLSQQGDILIVSYTDVGWSPYFPLISGLVTEMGGLVSHGKSVALLTIFTLNIQTP